MEKKIPYNSFSRYVLRTPAFSFSSFEKLTSGKQLSDVRLKKICKDAIFSEALFLASPALHIEMIKWLKNEKPDKKKEEKIKSSLLKYISRMSTRCTPFGLFAGCSIGSFDKHTQITLAGIYQNKRYTGLDMNYLVSLSQDLTKNKKIRRQLLFFPNTSIYKSGSKIRYIEYKYVNSNRIHQVIEVENTDYLKKILTVSAKGTSMSELAESLIDDEINMEEALHYIEELIDCQLLFSELEPTVSGSEFLEQISLTLKKLDGVNEILELIIKSKESLNVLDTVMGNDSQTYRELVELLKKIGTDFEPNFIFQSDLVVATKKNTLSHETVDAIKSGLVLLNKLTSLNQPTQLTRFKDAFYERFEEREVSLATALDVEIGLGYKQDINQGDVNPLVDDIDLPEVENQREGSKIGWNSKDMLIHKLLVEALKANSYTIVLDDDHFKDFKANWSDLPDTIACMVEVVKTNGVKKIKFEGGGGSSAANLLGRFCHADPKMHDLTEEIIAFETKSNPDKILAEIVHLPESRAGNILMRPAFREYEIPYLAKSVKNEKYQMPLSDLFISVRNGNRIVLRSQKHNKEVIPHLTNAHNFSHNSLPIYHFLCDMQTQGMRNYVGFSFGDLYDQYVFLPRVEYKNLIFHSATWNLKKSHIEPLLENINDNEELNKALHTFRKQLRIPQYVLLADGDNELLINFKNFSSARMLLDMVSKRAGFKLLEFLHYEKGVVKCGEDHYTNQVIVSFYNSDKASADGIQ